MTKIFIGIVVALVVLVGGFFAFNSYIYNEKQGDGPATSPKDTTYVVEGQVVTLKNGVSETEAAPGSSSKIVTRYFGNEVMADLNGDGREDAAFILTQETGGSGTFYYVVAALNKENGWEGSQALFLGDRIAPQTTEFRDGLVIVNYADRKPGEPMTAQPSIGKSIWLHLDEFAMQFGEVVQDFEGEADPAVMKLDMKSWTWTKTVSADATITPKQALAFTLDFFPDERSFSATTDCNRVSGSYSGKAEAGKGTISFEKMISTKMYCEGSQESDFTTMLGEAQSYRFTSRGEFILTLASGGEMSFR